MNPVLFMSGSLAGFPTAKMYVLHLLIWAVNFSIRHQHDPKKAVFCAIFTQNEGGELCRKPPKYVDSIDPSASLLGRTANFFLLFPKRNAASQRIDGRLFGVPQEEALVN